MKSHEPDCFYEIWVRDTSGSVVQYQKNPMQSFLFNWTRLQYATSANVTTFGIVATDGTTKTSGISDFNSIKMNAGVDDDTYGLVVGSGTNAVTLNDYALQTKILRGNAASTLIYQATGFSGTTVVGSTASFVVQRNFINSSGGSIGVNELGLYCKIAVTPTPTASVVRDVTPSTVTVADTQSLLVQYTISNTA